MAEEVGTWAVSKEGTLVYIPQTVSLIAPGSDTGHCFNPVWIDRNGNEIQIKAMAKNYQRIKISPDGTKIAFTIYEDTASDLYMWDMARENMTRLTFNGESRNQPIWTPDSKSIIFYSDHEQRGSYRFYKIMTEDTGEIAALGNQGGSATPFSMLADGKCLVVSYFHNTGSAIGLMSIDGDGDIKPVIQDTYNKGGPMVSPDGRWIAYTSDESGDHEVYVRPFPNVSDGKWKISSGLSWLPLWSPDSRELYYQTNDAIMVVTFQTESTFQPSSPKVLFKRMWNKTIGLEFTGPSWDAHPDGDRLLLVKPVPSIDNEVISGNPRNIGIVTNW